MRVLESGCLFKIIKMLLFNFKSFYILFETINMKYKKNIIIFYLT